MNIPPKIGKYRIIEKLGQGACGCVLKAEHEIIQRVVAMKVVFAHLLQEKPLIIRRFKREARLSSSIIHPNMVPIFEIGEANGMHYYTMQCIEGTPMTEFVKNNSPLTLREKLDICIELSDVLAVAHNRNIIHRDLKPHNVVITKDLHPVILDFGIAKSLIEGEQMTQAGHILGSVHYMAPEQAKSEEVGTYTDVFGLGVMMYELLAGRRPFEGNNVSELIIQRIRYRDNPETYRPSSMLDINPNLPEPLNGVVFRCLEASPQKRYQNAHELLLELKKIRRELLFEASLKEEKKSRPKTMVAINKKKSYFYPIVVALSLWLLVAAVGIWIYKSGESGWNAKIKSLQLQGAKIFKR